MYRSIFVTFLASILFITVSVQPVQAAYECQYGSTQARVQRDISDPWKSEVTITKGQSFNIGSFHNATGQFANDTVLQVVGPGMIEFFQNGNAIRPPQTGEYILYVNTRDQFGGGCSEQAKVIVKAQSNPPPTVKPTPVPTPIPPIQCSYQNTQARVQLNSNQPWSPVLGIRQGDSFYVGSFHNQTGQFANDTRLVVKAYLGDFRQEFSNGQRVSVPGLNWYQLKVTTRGQTGAACTDSAWVFVWPHN